MDTRKVFPLFVTLLTLSAAYVLFSLPGVGYLFGIVAAAMAFLGVSVCAFQTALTRWSAARSSCAAEEDRGIVLKPDYAPTK